MYLCKNFQNFMVTFANENQKKEIYKMWKICFNETDEWLDFYFSKRYKSENTLIYVVNNNIVASLQMYPYLLKCYGQYIPIIYLCGICTLPEERNKGFSKKLLKMVDIIIKQKNIPISILIPSNENLFNFYEKFDYKQVFYKNNEKISLKQILDANTSLESSYKNFCQLFENKDIIVWKSFEDFKII